VECGRLYLGDVTKQPSRRDLRSTI